MKRSEQRRPNLDGRIPIIRLWDCLLVPLQGDVGDAQASALTADVLAELSRDAVRGLVVDLSGAWLVDSHLCSVIAHLSRSAGLMGARTIVSGIAPDVTLSLLAMDVTLGDIETTLGVESALARLGIRPPQEGSDHQQRALETSLLALAEQEPEPEHGI